MKEFAVYTLLRLVLFAGALGITVGIWALFTDGKVPMIWAVVVAFLVSGVASLVWLNPQREKFAQVVQAKASRAAAKVEERKSREDEE